MAYLDPNEAFEHLKKRVLEGIQEQFARNPITGKKQSLHLEKLEVDDKLQTDDLRGQHKAKVENETWAVPVYATVALKHNDTGDVIDRRRIRIAEIPKTTSRHSYIIDGQEYQVDNQWQLRPGVYTRRRANGEIESVFNGGKHFDVILDPASKVLRMEYSGSRGQLPIYPLLKTLGVSDEELSKTWGKEVLEANRNARNASTALEKFYKADKPWSTGVPTHEVAADHFYSAMEKFHLRPESTQLTLGKPFDHVTGETLRLATEKMLKVQAGHPEDDRDSLVFKDLRTAGDYAKDAIRSAGVNIKMRALRQIDKAQDVWDVLKFDMFNKPIKGSLSSANAAARTATQINPLEMISSAQQTTVMGSGGIKKVQSVSNEAKYVNPSHLGFLDPLNTPEGEKTGITLRLPIGVRKVGHEAKIPLYNLMSKKTELLSPGEFMASNIVLPDQVRWEGDVPHPIHKLVRTSSKGNEIRDVPFDEAHYVMRHPSQLFNMTSNLIPFLGSTSGNRASMASRHMEQAVSLLHREAPLVQVDGPNGVMTFEHLMGQQASHESPVDGKVTEIKKDAIILQDHAGARHEVQIYNNYPLNEAKGVMHSTPLVAVGDSVKKGAVIADTNFSKNGTLALGTNLRVAYLPFKGYNFEDGVVISNSAAEKLSSEHLQKLSLPLDNETVLNKKSFHQSHPGMVQKAQYEKLGVDGVIRVGQKVQPGDPLIVAMKPFKLKDRTGLSAIRRSMSGEHTDKSLRWDSDFEGEVVGVHRTPKGLSVHVRTVEPMQVGDKISNRYGGKGIVTLILPDREMPHTKDGKHIEVALNPSGVPGRMNVGQLLETAAGKIAQKTGKSYIVKNFATNVDALAQVKADLAHHGLSDTESLKDPGTGQELGQVLVGPQHLFKLVHQVEKKLSVRSGSGSTPGAGPSEGYDLNLQPLGGKSTGGQSIGTLGLFALLAHGAKANIREMQSYKSEGQDSQTDPAKRWPSDHHKIWAAIQTGQPLPTPKPTFAFRKFEDMIRATGVNIDKKGHDLVLSPMTNDQILTLAKHALPRPADLLLAKVDKNGEHKPKPGGLWDEKLTGGLGGRQWTRIELAEPIPNPIFEKPIRVLTGLSSPNDFAAIVNGTKGVTANGHITAPDAGVTGGAGIELLLKRIDVKRDLAKAETQLKTVKGGQSVDKALKKVKYLRALDRLNMKPHEAYILHNVPVIPPIMRPTSTLPDGTPKFDDLNQLYSDFAKINDKLKDPILSRNLTDEGKAELRESYYDGVKAFMGIGSDYKLAKHKGLLHKISGSSPKSGYFQDKLISRRQDLTMRSTIVPEPALDLDEVGLPKHAALELFKPFVVRKLKEMGAIPDEMAGAAYIEKKNASVWRALEKVLAERPLLLKRDPALHKYNVQAFHARAIDGNAVRIHPLVTGGYNADFDGDTMSAYVPITREAVDEARRMMPSSNLFSEATGRLMYQPTLDSALGLYKLSNVGKDSHKSFDHAGMALDAVRAGHVGYTDIVHIGGKPTTAGRILLASALPEAMEQHTLHDLSYRINGKGLNELLTGIAKNYTPQYGEIINKLKDLGNGASFGAPMVQHATGAGHSLAFATHDGTPVATQNTKKNVFVPIGAHSLTLKDFTPDIALRERILAPVHKSVAELYANTELQKSEQDRRAIALYEGAADEMKVQHEKKQDKDPSNLFTMYRAGVKPGWDQYKQMVLAPMIYKDSTGEKIPTPVTKSYAEGLDVGSYWTQMHGARRGSVMKVQETSGPGYLSKMLMSNMMHILVNSPDCGTDKGVLLDVSEPDIHDRYLQQEFTHGKLHIPAGTLLAPDVVGKIRAASKSAKLLVRSPLKCEDEKGICQKCAGMSSSGQHYDLGHNIGVQSAQAVGERGIQLALKNFHCMHEHSLVLLRKDGRVFHSTLGRVFQNLPKGSIDGREETRAADGLEVWDRGGWVRIKTARAHPQEYGTLMTFTRARSGYGIVSQDNHPHMLRENLAVCSSCRTYPKRSNRGRQYYCRKCLARWRGAPKTDTEFGMVEVRALDKKSHAALLDRGPAPSVSQPPLRSGWLAGIYASEGCILVRDDTYEMGIMIAQNSGTATYARIHAELQREFGAGTYGPTAKGYQVYGRARALRFQNDFGRYSRSKGLPDGWSGYAPSWLSSFVCGVLDGDGTHVCNDDSAWITMRLDTTSLLLAQQVHWVLRGFGISARIIATPWRKISRHQPYAVQFVVTQRAKDILKDSSKLRDIVPKPAAHEERFDDVVDYVHLVRFEERPTVYDLETETGTLFVGGFWTHNTGGVGEHKGGSKLLNSFERFNQLMELPKTIPDEASLAMQSGKVEKITPTATGADIYIGGHRHHVGRDVNGMALHHSLPGAEAVEGYIPWKVPAVGTHFDAGEHLSDPNRSILNPHHLYAATGSIEKVQNHLTHEVYDLYKDEGIKRRAIETVVRAMSNLTQIKDPGDHPDVLRGEFRPMSAVYRMNQELLRDKKHPIEHAPVMKGVHAMPLAMQEDWMAKLQHERLRGTFRDAAAEAGISHLHGNHPIPAIAYGAEFGLTVKDSLRPGYEHLHNVPAHHY